MTGIHLLALKTVLGVSLAVTAVAAQDPLAINPAAYRLAFENAWVKVVRVHYAPKAVIAPHFHTEQAAAYVYLNDGGPIVFKHEGLPYGAVTRPATKAGSFRVYKGLKEVHSVENPTDTPNDFLRVEFKTEPVDEATLRGKFFRDAGAAAGTAQRVQFENAQVRITRVVVSPGDTLELSAPAEEPSLIVSLTSAVIRRPGSPDGDDVRRLEVAETAWLDAGAPASVRNTAATPVELLRFAFRTRPRHQ
jgi:hypothetical protein